MKIKFTAAEVQAMNAAKNVTDTVSDGIGQQLAPMLNAMFGDEIKKSDIVTRKVSETETVLTVKKYRAVIRNEEDGGISMEMDELFTVTMCDYWAKYFVEVAPSISGLFVNLALMIKTTMKWTKPFQKLFDSVDTIDTTK